ncbi:nucleotidyltransferase family protein [bacterium]|nr:nucleotidyltransferase family protein [bacterium]
MNEQLPNKAESLLLQACLSDGDKAIDAWRTWQETTPFDDIDLGCRRLLPLLHDNLRRLGVDDPILTKYEGLKKLHWFQNRLLMFQLEAILKTFSENKIRPLLIKGCALNAQGLFAPGLRPMTDMDIVVRADQALEAAKLVAQLGWQAKSGQGRSYNESDVRFAHHGKFEKDPGLVIELHWETASQFFRGEPSDTAWSNATLIHHAGQPCCGLAPADHLLLILAHGGYKNNISPIRWVTDAIAILNAHVIDWDYFVSQAKQHRLAFAVRGMLTYLKSNYFDAIPIATLNSLDAVCVTPFERRVWTTLQSPNQQVGFRAATEFHWIQLQRKTGGRISIRAFFSYLKYTTSLRRNGKGLSGLLKNIGKRLRNTIRPQNKPELASRKS